METNTSINKLLKIVCLTLFAIMLPGFIVGQNPVAVNDSDSVNEGEAVTIDITVNDTDADGTIDDSSIALGTAANGSIVDNGDGTVTYTHNGSETTSDSFTYTVNDNDGLTSNPATVTITITPQNDEPVFTSSPVTSVNEDESYSYTIIASDDDAGQNPTFALSVDPPAPWLSLTDANINDGQAILTGTPTNSEVGTYEVTLTATPSSTPVTQVFNLTVNNTNDDPVFTSFPVTSVNEDESYSYTIIASDDDAGQIPTFALSVDPPAPWLSITDANVNDGQAILTGTPTNSEVGTYEVTLTATPSSTPVTQVFNLTVNNTNDDPVFTSFPVTSVNEDESYSYTIIASDDDAGQNPTFALSVDPPAPWLSITDANINDGQAILTGTPTNSEVGIYEVTLTATPSSTSVTQVFNLTVNNTNDDPVFTSSPVTSVNEDESYSYTIIASDDDAGQNPTFALSVDPPAPWLSITDANINDGQAILTGTPTNSEVGTYEVTLTANPSSTPVTQVFNLTVNNTNDDPVFTSSPVTSVNEDESYSYTIIASDDDAGQNPTFALSVDPPAPWLSLTDANVNDGQAILTGTPTNSEVGTYEVTLTANPSSTPVTQVFNLTVNNTNDDPVFTSSPVTSVNEDESYSYTIIASDDDAGQNPTFALSVVPPAPWLSITDANVDDGQAILTGTPTNSEVGTYEVTLTATPSSTSVTQVFNLTVNNTNDDPVFTSSPVTSVNEDESYSYTIIASDDDAGQNPTFALSVDPPAPWLSITDANVNDGQAILTGTPTNSEVGVFEVTLTATPSSTSVTQVFNLTVNDIFGELSISQSSNGNENGTDGSFRINISRQLIDVTNITVTTSSNSAVIGDDFTIAPIQLPANTSFIDVPVEIINDDLIETDETVLITLSSTDNVDAIIGSPDNATITISDNDGELTITDASTVNGEEGGSNGSFTINTSREFPIPTTITVSTSSNSAVVEDDFTISTITLDANTSDVVVPLTILDDNLAEGTENVTVTLEGISDNINAHIAASNISTTISIADNEVPDITINGGPFIIDEGTSGHVFDIGLSAQPLSDVKVDISCVNPDISFSPSTITFTNANWADRQISFSASQDSDLLSEGDDINIIVDNTNSNDAFDGLSKIIELTVRDDDAAGLVTTGGPFTISEGSTGNTFTVGLAAQPASNVVIDIRSENTDISFTPNSVTFTNADWSAQTISFSANEDADLIDELNPIIAEVNNASSDDAFDNQSSIINLTVNDNDQAELSIIGTTNAEEDAISGAFTINASQATHGNTDITLSIGGTATMGSDYESINTTITMPDGANSLSIPINLINDNLVEGLENINIELVAVNNSKTSISGTANSASIDISDNDIADLVLSQTTFSVNEGTSNYSFEIALSAQPQSDVVIDLLSNNLDIVLSSNSLTFTNASYGNQTVTFNCIEDDDLSNESANIAVAVNNPASNSLFYDLSSQITVDITDNDTQPIFESVPITVTNEDVLYTYNINVSDADGDIPVITLVTPVDPASTWLTLTDNNDGTAILSGTPLQADVTGSGSPINVTIRAEDDLTSVEQSFTITVNNVNDSPQINNSSFSTPENQALVISLNSFASDEDENLDPSTLVVTSQPDYGTVDINTTNGEITYTPNNAFSGEDNFNVQIQDLNTAYSNVGTITITVSDEAPTAVDDSYTINEDEGATFAVLENDVDPQNNLSNASLVIIDAPTKGTAVVNTTTGTITYTPNINENGEDSFTYRICDTGDYCDQASVNITITPVNDNPIVNEDSYTLNEDSNIELTILDNDSDVDGSINTETITIVTDVTNGTLTVNATSITYSPNQDFYGSDSFVYSVEDNEGASSQASVTLTIEPVNDVPIAIDDEGTTSDVSSIVINVVENDIDVDGNLDLASLNIVSQPAHGSVTINGTTGNITYEPDLNYYGADSYQYQICDTDGECSTATVRLTVTTGNAKPIANTDYKSVDEDGTINFNPLENDNDPNFNLDFESLTIIEGPRFGTHQHTSGSTNVTYSPNSNYYGNDTIVYQILDLGNPPLSDQDTVFITVNPINDQPVAADYHLNVVEGSPAIVNLAEMGSDIEMQALTISIHPNSPTIPGQILILNQTALQYTASIGSLCNRYEIKYLLTDTQGGQDDATVYVNVLPLDSDNDNIPDAIENSGGNNVDTDSDGMPDYLDDDSDNDGISDLLEGGITDMCVNSPLDSDNDGLADYLDLDSDNDQVLDKNEGYDDCDNDGIPNSMDDFDDCASRVLNIPEYFIPGSSDPDYQKFIIKGAETLTGDKLVVFNRWGGQVYSNSDYDNSWRGLSSSSTLGSEELPEGTYFYVYKTKEGQVIKGTVYIKR